MAYDFRIERRTSGNALAERPFVLRYQYMDESPVYWDSLLHLSPEDFKRLLNAVQKFAVEQTNA